MAVYGYCWGESDKSKRGSVYFIRDGIGNIKIGVAKDVDKRKAGLQTANPNELEIFYIMSVPNMEYAVSIEKALHDMFNKERVRGEWFKEKNILGFLREPEIKIGGFRFEGATW
jgi:predicted GIY-YIG superfamily endonuclease